MKSIYKSLVLIDVTGAVVSLLLTVILFSFSVNIQNKLLAITMFSMFTIFFFLRINLWVMQSDVEETLDIIKKHQVIK